MSRLGRLLKTAGKWAGIMLLIYIGATFLSGLDFETRMGWVIGGIALAIAYVDGSLKDRIATLEHQVEQLNRHINGRW